MNEALKAALEIWLDRKHIDSSGVHTVELYYCDEYASVDVSYYGLSGISTTYEIEDVELNNFLTFLVEHK